MVPLRTCTVPPFIFRPAVAELPDSWGLLVVLPPEGIPFRSVPALIAQLPHQIVVSLLLGER
jgi:hypothetical protein